MKTLMNILICMLILTCFAATTWAFSITMGNDILMGKETLNPEPATMILLGFSLIGLAGLGRKTLNKK
ncbi:PEP-CTERM sorting domain-containing protein [Desulfospira joergensenii]|uniref:PEP-CTERM sorting domain-containing protein n=1 Tax=Desulfospira joergensenii TaxID=53329 RepID=UPI0003B4D290|nr:PEP-CTERM sorting domain-containing protein [Desulfospira joergensenii]